MARSSGTADANPRDNSEFHAITAGRMIAILSAMLEAGLTEAQMDIIMPKFKSLEDHILPDPRAYA
jgi:hypothetical protein